MWHPVIVSLHEVISMSEGGDEGHLPEARLDVDPKLLGFDAEYYHADSGSLVLSEEERSAYEADPENSKIFISTSSGNRYSANQMISMALKESSTPEEALVPPQIRLEAIEKGIAKCQPHVHIEFKSDACHLITSDGPVTLKRVTFNLELTARPRGQS